MTVFVGLSAILAAMIVFRAARYLVMVALLVTLGFFVMRFEAWKAEQPPMELSNPL